MRHTIEITRHNCPADGDSITAEVTLDVSDGVTSDTTDDCASPTVKHLYTEATELLLDDTIFCLSEWYMERLARELLERDCDPVALAIDKLRAADLSGGVK